MGLYLRTVCRVIWLNTFGGPRFHLGRVLATLIFIPAILFVGAGLAFFLALDHLLFGRFRKQPVKRPVFIIGNPRSGTTFFHWLLCLDQRQFAHITLAQTIFPAISQDRLWRLIGRIDRAVFFSLGTRLVKRFEKWAFRGWDGIHTIGLQRPEECEAIWVLSMFTPSVYMLCPFIDRMPELKWLDKLPERRRRRLMRYYRGILQRRLYADGKERVFLGKNVFHTGRLRSLVEEFPDVQLVHLVRHPYSVIASLLSMFTKPWHAHSRDLVPSGREVEAMAEIGIDYYRYMLEVQEEIPANQLVTVTYDELMGDARGTVARVYEALGWELEPEFALRLEQVTQASRSYTSRHEYSLEAFGLSEDWVYERIPEIFERYSFER